MYNTLAREHVSKQGMLAREHVSTKDTLTLKHFTLDIRGEHRQRPLSIKYILFDTHKP